jgi:DNA (cytosine-5)-methyltransferase 1
MSLTGNNAGSIGPQVGIDIAATLNASNGQQVYSIASNIVGRSNKNGGHHLGIGGDISYTLDTTGPPSVCAFAQNQRNEVRNLGNVASTLSAQPGVKQQTYLAFSAGQGAKAGGLGIGEGVSPTLRSSQSGTNMVPTVAYMGGTRAKSGVTTDGTAMTLVSGNDYPITASLGTVRRLMPVECERLQGFPDGHTDVPYKGRPATDSRRYAAIGNSMAVPVIRWIGDGIEAVEAYRKEEA